MYVFPKRLAIFGQFLQQVAQTGGVAGHAALVPHQPADFAVNLVGRAPALRRRQLINSLGNLGLGLLELGVAGIRPALERLGIAGQVVADRIGRNEVAVGQTLHQGAGPEAIGPVVGEIRLA